MSAIADLRAKLNMTQDEFAEHCGVSRISIARYEAGAKISRANAIKIAKACNTTIDYLLYDTEEIIVETADAEDDAVYILTEAEKALIRDYRALSADGQAYIRQTMAMAINTMGQNETVSVLGAG